MERYSVILKGFTRGPEWFRSRMLRHGAKIGQVEKIIQAVPCVLKAGLAHADAKRMEETFVDAGGVIELKLEGEAALPAEEAAPPAGPPAVEEAGDSSPFVRAPRRSNPVPMSSEMAAVGFAPSADIALDGTAPPAGVELLDVSGAAAPGAGRAKRGTGQQFATDQVAYDPSTPSLDLLDVAPRPARKTDPPPAEGAGPAPVPMVATPLPQLAGVTVTPKMGEFKTYNPWIGRGIAIGGALIAAIVLQTCVGSYKVADRLHTFSAYGQNDLEQEMMLVGRANGTATRADVIAIAKKFGQKAHVRVDVTDVMEERVSVMEAPTLTMDYGSAPASGRCAAAPPRALESMPMDKRMEWAQMSQTCNYPNWIIGFSATVTARYGLSKDKVYVEHWAFVWRYTTDEELEAAAAEE